MGYAESVAALARGAELGELRTGDLARLAPDGLWEIVGRLNRQAKVFGLRLDLSRLEEQVDGCRIVAEGETLHVFTTRPRHGHRLRDDVVARSGLPPSAVRVHRLESMPTTPTGKVDHGALLDHARAAEQLRPATAGDRVTAEGLRDQYAVLLGRPEATVDDSFVSLGGDSLSFVEVSSRAGRMLGVLPPGWQHRSVADLAALARPPRRHTAPLEMSVLLRAVALLMVVVAHVDLAPVEGGAHVLLAVVGFNLARFSGAVPGRVARVRRMLGSAAAVAVPAVLWIAMVALVTGQYRPATAALLNGALGGDAWSDQWQFWFLEAALWTTVACALALAVPAVDRWQRAHRFAAPVTLVAAALVLRYAWTGVEAGPTERYSTLLVLWCFAAGWAAAEARTGVQRLVVVALTVLGVAGFFGDLQREAIVAVGVTLLLWARPVHLPVALAVLLRTVAGASLWIYLTHWQVYPPLEDAGHPVAALLASLAVGITACWCYSRAARRVRQTPRSSASTIR